MARGPSGKTWSTTHDDHSLADPRLSAEVHVAEIPALILAKGAKVGERPSEPRKGPIRDKNLGDLWRLMAVANPRETRPSLPTSSTIPTSVSISRQSV